MAEDGKLLEIKLYDELHKVFDEIYLENELRNTYGWDASGIDHLVVFNDLLIPIQTKYRKTRRKENNGINSFLKSVKYVSEKMNKDIYFGLWVSRLEPFTDNMELMRNYKIECVNCIESMENLVEMTMSHIKTKL